MTSSLPRYIFLFISCGLATLLPGTLLAGEVDYAGARGDPIHFSPAIESATDDQCLSCHGEVLERKPLASSPAGVAASDTLAWYQTLDTYEGEQDTFHRRHLVTPLAERLMDMRCTTCHQGSNYREEAPVPPSADAGFTLRKAVDPNVCLMCHGKFNYQAMGLPMPWTDMRESMNNNCLTCHATFRTNRHQVNFLHPDEIEVAGAESGDVCYGCHGGRAWYRVSYPYPRHSWPGMPPVKPDWAKNRPEKSDPRFLE